MSDLAMLITNAITAEKLLTPLQRAILRAQQRRSWVCAEMRMNDNGSDNGLSESAARMRYEQIFPEALLLSELERRMAEDAGK